MSEPQVRGRALACTLVGLLLGAGIGAAQAHEALANLQPGHPTGHLQRAPGMTWPPQPTGAQNIIDRSDYSGTSRRSMARDLVFRAMQQRIDREPALSRLRGRTLTPLAVIDVDDRARGLVVERRFQYFDRRTNETVTVAAPTSGAPVVSTTPATVYQPEITQEEAQEAIDLAKAYFVRQGNGRAQQLAGFGIQAYQPTGSGFYNGRVVYVTLHVNNDSNPEFMAWVDLSAQRILKARQETRQ
ncbi:hypothetical protein QTI66_13360 [Variovorax sp. J22R133]|uniref:hypothetical protein n=1 Tax=Variovorax brevis TaxID=3053503 RepID=UPI002579080D|nr:hypothetical protein [Variovorax sp. J22R133]MDM0113141.1 hypothetical protein [Variovorax sp. J22R133]